MMNTVPVELSIDQLKQALRKLPAKEKVAIWRMLDSEIDRTAITKKFDSAVKSIREQYYAVDEEEEEVIAEINRAVHETRKAKYGTNRS
jgi:predicted  nucleic acid-binding Zn-ribbon protein